jgi:PAS domain S-box-containing protein
MVAPRALDHPVLHGFLEAAPDAIVVVDEDGHIAAVNALTEKMFGYGHGELLGHPVERLVPDRARWAHEGQRRAYVHEPRTRPMGAGLELSGRRKDGTEFPVEISLSPLRTDERSFVVSIIRDTSERRHVEARMRQSLREKEVLLKEIHHRVKNNLQVTSSLLKLQSAGVHDPQARALFAESQNRIRSMALVHEKLYQSRDLSSIDFADYVDSLAVLLYRSYGIDPERIRLRVTGAGVHVSIEVAVPCGLILNELLSNSFKHAFPGNRHGEIRVDVQRQDGAVRLVVADDGVGLPDAVDLEHGDTLGLQLVRTLADQLGATAEIVRGRGTEVRVQFREVHP